MTVMDYAAFRKMRGVYHGAALAADARGDAEAARINRDAAADLLTQVRPPRLLPRDTDEALEERAFAHKLADHAWHKTHHSYDVVSRQGMHARRLDALVIQRGQE